MKTYDDLEFNPKPSGLGGSQARLDFPNGYGVSVITGFGAYGGEKGLFELAVFDAGNLTYDTPVTNDVEGYLSPEQVTKLMKEVQELPVKEEEPK